MFNREVLHHQRLGNPSLLNKRSEFVNNCHKRKHKRKLLLKFMKDSKDELF